MLFEPIVISETMTKYRSMYPQASKTAPYAAWDKVVLDIGAMAGSKTDSITVKYSSPYADIPLEPKMKEKDRDRFCPNFDKELNSKTVNSHHLTCEAIYKNLLFFFGPKTGGRSHYYTLNFIMGCIAAQNDHVSGEVLKYLADSVILLTDKAWMMEENMLGVTKIGNTMSDISSKISSLTAPKDDDADGKDKKTDKKQEFDYKQPITSVITPCIGSIIKESTNPVQIANALICLASISNYFTDEQISRVLLPQVNNALDNISKYPKAIVGFA